VGAAVRHFDERGFGAVPLPKVPAFVVGHFPQPAFQAALAAPLPAEQSTPLPPDATPPRCRCCTTAAQRC